MMSTSNRNNNGGGERTSKRKPPHKHLKKNKGHVPPNENQSNSGNGTAKRSPVVTKPSNVSSPPSVESNTYSGSSFHSSPATSSLPRPSFANGSTLGSPPHRQPVAMSGHGPGMPLAPGQSPGPNMVLGCQPYPPPYNGQQYMAPMPAPIYPQYGFPPPMGMPFMPAPQSFMAGYGHPPPPQPVSRARST